MWWYCSVFCLYPRKVVLNENPNYLGHYKKKNSFAHFANYFWGWRSQKSFSRIRNISISVFLYAFFYLFLVNKISCATISKKIQWIIPKKQDSLCDISRHCAYIIYSLKTWFLKNISVPNRQNGFIYIAEPGDKLQMTVQEHYVDWGIDRAKEDI